MRSFDHGFDGHIYTDIYTHIIHFVHKGKILGNLQQNSSANYFKTVNENHT